jgi:hypothetical protein
MEPYSPWLRGHFRFQLVQALAYGRLSDADFDRALPAILELFRTTVNHSTVNAEIEPVLHRGFGDRPLPDGATRRDLGDRQERVLRALHDNEALWNPRSGNLSLVLRRIGLANDRALVGRLLG